MSKQRSTQSRGSGNAEAITATEVGLAEEARCAIERSLQGEEAWSQEMAEVVDQALASETLAPSVQQALRGLAKDHRRGEKRIRKMRRRAKRLRVRP
jgi:hypothetical protein